jgi:hypothetical protein
MSEEDFHLELGSTITLHLACISPLSLARSLALSALAAHTFILLPFAFGFFSRLFLAFVLNRFF